MAHRELISISVDNKSNTVKGVITQYEIFLTENGHKIQKITKQRIKRRGGKHSTKDKILLRVYRNTNQREHVKVKPGKNTKINIREPDIKKMKCEKVMQKSYICKSKMKSMQHEEEDAITNAMQQLSIQRNNNRMFDKPLKKQRKTEVYLH